MEIALILIRKFSVHEVKSTGNKMGVLGVE